MKNFVRVSGAGRRGFRGRAARSGHRPDLPGAEGRIPVRRSFGAMRAGRCRDGRIRPGTGPRWGTAAQWTVTLKTGDAVLPLTMRRSFLPFRPSSTRSA